MRARRLRPLFVVLGASSLLALAPLAARADIYSYTDAEGVVHFTNRPGGDTRYKLYARTAPAKRKKTRPAAEPSAPSDRTVERFTRFDATIRQAATLYQIPEALIRAVMKVESDYDARAVSHAGACGLMQLMPQTAGRMQVRDIFDPQQNILGGTRYLRILANTFNGDLELTIAGYNAGEGAVTRYGGIPPYEETQDYVLRVLHYYHRYRTVPDVMAASSSPVPGY
ncbi:MAG: lytic transglycosylase domain-containing protein [Myxococcales bacterium]|nr:lytic transglycosylase domain-containing protein [Myxococcales bacterium]